ncbi:MAG: trypsin-like peptidase domain-containing protein [bacterium]|nr:trypsin-like peptidase domain-containing protein [bacterium]
MVTPVRRVVSGLALLLIIAGAFVFGTVVAPGLAQERVSFPAQDPFTQVIPDNATANERLYATIYTTASPSVVSINVITSAVQDQFGSEGLAESTGTGFVIDTNGHIVTNAHVVEDSQRIEINFFDGRIVRAELVGIDRDSDVAVVRVAEPAETLQPLQFGDSDALFIGQEVVAIGSPFNQPWTMTTGIISALGRTINGLNNFSIGSVIQTDAAINPGNSGGPLLDLNGNVIGVNSQIISRTRSNSGIGFAIPSNLVSRIAQSLIADGEMDYSYLGISGTGVSLDIIEALNLPNNARGVVVARVEPGTPAAQAGLRNPANPRALNGANIPTSVDIITQIDGEPLRDMSDLIAYLASNTMPGQIVTLTVVRDGVEELQVPVTLVPRPTS